MRAIIYAGPRDFGVQEVPRPRAKAGEVVVDVRLAGVCGTDLHLARVGAVTLHGSPKRRTPTALFSVAGHSGRDVTDHLARADVNAPASSFYAIEAARWMGLGDAGAVRAGLAPYTDDDDVDRLLAGVAEMVR